MTDAELIAYGAELKARLETSINNAIEEALRLRAGDQGAYESVMCQHADAVGEDFRFTLLDFVSEPKDSPTTVPAKGEPSK